MKKNLLIIFVVISLLAVIAVTLTKTIPTSSSSVEEVDTLKKIRASGTLVLGQRQDAVPFSYYDDNTQQVIGYSQDLARVVIDAVKAELKLPTLKVVRRAITTQNRFALIQDGSVDLECGSTAHTAERDKLVTFSNSFFVGRMRLMTRKDYDIHDFSDLVGKTVVTTAATTNLTALEKMNDEKKMGMNIIATDDNHEGFLALQNKRAVAFLMDDVLLNGERIRAIRWGDWIITGTPQAREAYGCTLRKGDVEFKNIVDRALAAAMATGEAGNIYKKWFMSPIPPNGINLNFPMSSDLIELFKSPNDKIL